MKTASYISAFLIATFLLALLVVFTFSQYPQNALAQEGVRLGAPAVRITSPNNGAQIMPGQSIDVEAVASSSVSAVDFFAGDVAIGSDSTAPFTTSFTPDDGEYVLRAVATLESGATSSAFWHSVTARRSTSTDQTVQVAPGDDIQALVDANPVRTKFEFAPGTYRQQLVRPKDGNVFDGGGQATMTGAKELSFVAEGNFYVSTGHTETDYAHGECKDNSPRCGNMQDLYIDDRLQKHVTSTQALDPGEWYFDYDNDRIYLPEDPGTQTVELSSTPQAFLGEAEDVTIKGFTIEKYASRAQSGAINARKEDVNAPISTGWIIADNIVKQNHGGGIEFGDRSIVENNVVVDNGQIGIIGLGDNTLIEGNEIARNNQVGFSIGWEAGGTKFVRTNQLVVRDNYSHDNLGPGLWTDIDNVYTIYEQNRIIGNDQKGIQHEISYDATIRDNLSKNNGETFDVWLWGAQILVQNSQNVDVYNNSVATGDDFGDGIAIILQQRGSGNRGAYTAQDNRIFNNNIHIFNPSANTGGVGDCTAEDGCSTDSPFHNNKILNNVINMNEYHLLDPEDNNFSANTSRTFSEFQAAGFEANGSVDGNLKNLDTVPASSVSAHENETGSDASALSASSGTLASHLITQRNKNSTTLDESKNENHNLTMNQEKLQKDNDSVSSSTFRAFRGVLESLISLLQSWY